MLNGRRSRTVGLADLAVLRRGIGLLPPAGDPDPGLAAIVHPDDPRQRAARTCTCRASRERTCAHQLLLGERLREAERRWGGLGWEVGFTATLWGRLAPMLFAGERGRRVSVEVRRLSGGGLEISGRGSEARILVLDASPSAATSLLELLAPLRNTPSTTGRV